MTDLKCILKKLFNVAFLAIMISLFPGLVFGQSRTEIIAVEGQTLPDGNGTLSGMFSPVMNDSGVVAFWAAPLTGTSGGNIDDGGIFRGSGGPLTQIAREGQVVPGGNGTISGFQFPAINDSGSVAFNAQLTGTSGGSNDDDGIYVGTGLSLTQIARGGQAAPDGNGMFSFFHNPLLSNSNQATFSGFLTGTSGGASDDAGIFRGNGGALVQIIRKGQALPIGPGTFGSFQSFRENNSGAIALVASLNGTSGGNTDNSGLFRVTNGSITQIARRGQAAPDGNGLFSTFLFPGFNDSGVLAFRASLSGTSGGLLDDNGIYRTSGGAITQIVREGQAAPDGNGTFSLLFEPVFNNFGAVSFRAGLSGTSGGSSDDGGIYRSNGTTLTQIAREGQATPGGNGTFAAFGSPALNDFGVNAFRATLSGTSGGSNDDLGLFISDGIESFNVARKGSLVNGSAITDMEFNFFQGGLNNSGQVAYRVTLANGDQVIQRFTPELHWRTPTSSSWDAFGRWTLGLRPGQVHDVFIDPSSSLTVTGPSAVTTLRSLRIGGGTGLATLSLQNGVPLTVTNGVTIQSTGTLTGNGSIIGNMTNNGTVVANNVSVAGTLTNNGVIRGNGLVNSNVVNTSSGRIRASSGESLFLSGPSLSNFGLIDVSAGELRVSSAIVNQPGTSLISLRDGALTANGGINNLGRIAATNGTSSLRGKIDNTGIIEVSNGAMATFDGDIIQNGVMQVTKVGNVISTAMIQGMLSGSGGFVGGGDVIVLGELSPGNSPASVLYDGNLFLGNSAKTIIELGGLQAGRFDQLIVTGDLTLNGDLLVSIYDDFLLGANQSFLIGNVGNRLFDEFNNLGEGALVGNFNNHNLFITYRAGDGNDIAFFSAIPEPSSMFLLMLGSGSLVFVQRRSGRRS